MLKTFLILLVLSVLGIIWLGEINHGLRFLVEAYSYVANTLGLIIKGNHWAHIARQSIALLLIPIIIALIPAFLYWLVKKRHMPYVCEIACAVWLVLLISIAVL